MTQHFTKATVEASKWCGRCKRFTAHFVSDRRIGGCKECGVAKEVRPVGQVTYVDLPCICFLYPFPHFHRETQPLWTRPEGQKKST